MALAGADRAEAPLVDTWSAMAGRQSTVTTTAGRRSGRQRVDITSVPLRELMAGMGHASPQAALIYQHATAERERDSAGARTLALTARDCESRGGRLRLHRPPPPVIRLLGIVGLGRIVVPSSHLG